ncbi:GTP-binding protein Rhes isoform X2 [Carlito syrichta]|uniref:GTP-binding protein Rhes isoform X2 n=1 Tax=Carlito syrichta TaxID=1868482 RepID=A0A3Q0DXD7_CARSF|nr:GTP-binding protein Rhes isoform X2 [Carlito syrichta]
MMKTLSSGNCTLSVPAKNSYRMVVLGASRVGKSSIVSRFLNGRFEDQYTPTIEDFHRKVYNIRGDMYQLDILDTSGNHPFPAMRRLSILTDPGGQVLPEEQDQGGGGAAHGHLWQQERPRRAVPPGAHHRGRAAGVGRRELRLLRGVCQEEHQRGRNVLRALQHGQAAARDEPRPAPQDLRAVR